MAKIASLNGENEEIVIQMSPWGEFFVWVARHAEQLRREHRIVGHLSVSTTSKAPSTAAGYSFAPTVSLPLRLSLEETALVLFRRFAVALDSIRPLRCLDPPSPHSLSIFDRSLALHRSQSLEIYKHQKRQRIIKYHNEILKGQNKRKARETAKASRGCIKNASEDDTVIDDEKGVEMSMARLKKRKKITSTVELALDHPENDHSNSADNQKGEISETLKRLPTLDESMLPISSDDAKAVTYIPLYRPCSSPLEWRRRGEHTTLSVPETACGSIEKVAIWLLEVSSKLRLEGNEAEIVRCRVFDDLWSRNLYVTCSASKMGGDFLVYQGDPLFHHASHIVIANPPQTPIFLSRLSASLRIANSVRKALVLATTATDDQGDWRGDIAYTSLYWMGSGSAQ